ncbi:hypothetical protein BHU24_04945 [Bacillus pseudomycoides]|uniref:hypothetical protein n=1 Tax=Bacillus pseudomycoides TaxID=64104 RepID=UPI000BEFFF80|nr:hypothetical protein [Bacillus pseudomycoides]MBD5800157.1 hypothetical protein [Bacillus pseudomycoides]MCR8859211.1 hypothetical protein [Bacillus pseudomycoides]MED1475260.1 hypothetical protein [Bacillus pseudomycoides]PEJ23732.1 hypothetical protein CN887_18515 [Bacillus pseudomycoides]PEK39914.1 hypothetical protein CN691_01575 [Bacillus pseudomycoides]
MQNLNIWSYLFFFIAVTGAIIESSFITSYFFYYHYFKPILLVEIISPIIGTILGSFGKPGKPKQIAIILNSLFFVLFSFLALLNLWITTFGK